MIKNKFHFLILSIVLFFITHGVFASTHYFVAASGNDGNSGTSSGSPFATIGHAASVVVKTDTISINGGDVFSENVVISTFITLNSYGTGKGIIYGSTIDCIVFQNVGGIVDNIISSNDIVTSNFSTGIDTTTSIFCSITDGIVHNEGFRLTNSEIAGNMIGFYVRIASYAQTGQLNHIYVNNNVIHDGIRQAIGLGILATATNTAHSDVIIDSNTIYNYAGANLPLLTGTGILCGSMNSVLGMNYIQNNLVYHCGYNSGTGGGGGPSGIFPQQTNGCIVQHNFSHDIGYGTIHVDGVGMDIDLLSENVIFQYNVTYHNEGAGILYDSDLGGNTIRFNLSIDDAWGPRTAATTGAINVGNSGSCKIYNNTIVRWSSSGQAGIEIANVGNSGNKNIYNNLVVCPFGSSAIEAGGTLASTCNIDHNSYQSSSFKFLAKANGTTYNTLAAWQAGVIKDTSSVQSFAPIENAVPLPNITPQDYSQLKNYAPLNTSVAAQTGADLNSLFGITTGTMDITGRPLTVPYSIGAVAFSVPATSAYTAQVMSDRPFLWEKLNDLPGSATGYDTMMSVGTGTYSNVTLGAGCLVPNTGMASSSFSATSVYFATTTAFSISVASFSPISIEYWMNTSTWSATHQALSIYSPTFGSYTGITGPSGTEFRNFYYDRNATGLFQNTSGSNGQLNNTYHVMSSFVSSTNTIIYVNGIAQTMATSSGPSQTGFFPINSFVAAGQTNYLPSGFAGQLSNIMVYPSSFTASQALQHFQAGIRSPSSGFLASD